MRRALSLTFVWLWLVAGLAHAACPSSTTYDTTIEGEASLQGYWPLSDPSGTTATDCSAGAHNGTYGSGVTLAQTGFVDSATAVSFAAGTNNDISIPLPAQVLPVTIEFAVKSTSAPIGIFDTAPSGANTIRNFNSGSATNSTNGFESQGDASHAALAGFFLGVPHLYQVEVTKPSTVLVITVYRDNVQIANVTTTATTLNWSNPFRVGDINSGANGKFVGTLEKFAVYNVALTPTQIANHWNAIVNKFATPTESTFDKQILTDGAAAYYPMYDGTRANGGALNELVSGLLGFVNGTPTNATGGAFDGEAALAFSGTGQNIALSDFKQFVPSLPTTAPITFMFAFKATSNANGVYSTFDGAAPTNFLDASGTNFNWAQSGVSTVTQAVGSVSGAWHLFHVVYTFTGGNTRTVTYYKDGSLIGSGSLATGTSTITWGTGTNLPHICVTADTTTDCAGTMQKFAIFFSALNQTTISHEWSVFSGASSSGKALFMGPF